MDSTALIPVDIQTNRKWKWRDFVDGGNGFLYGIPYSARRVVQFSPQNKSIKEIGFNLGSGYAKYCNGIRADNGSIYCLPNGAECFLKITPLKGGNAEIKDLKERKLPRSWENSWYTGAYANDGCIYYMPYNGSLILKLDTRNDDKLTIIGDDFGEDMYINGRAVLGNDGCIYGASNKFASIMKFNPIDKSICIVGTGCKLATKQKIDGGLIVAHDGNIYGVNYYGQIVKINPSKNDFTLIGEKICDYGGAWGSPVLGGNKCIYFPPNNHDRVLKFNPNMTHVSLVGDCLKGDKAKWYGATLSIHGFIYCIPCNDKNILQIDTRHVNEQVLGLLKMYR